MGGCNEDHILECEGVESLEKRKKVQKLVGERRPLIYCI